MILVLIDMIKYVGQLVKLETVSSCIGKTRRSTKVWPKRKPKLQPSSTVKIMLFTSQVTSYNLDKM